jgi:hypothetical protein
MGVTGDALRDLSGRNNHGTLINMDPTTDWQISEGQCALNFDGSDNNVRIDRNLLENPAQTATAWIRGTTFPGAYNTVICKNEESNRYWAILVKSNGKMAYYVHANAPVFVDGTGASTLATGRWHFVALSYSATAGLTGYVDGVIDDTAAANGSPTTGSSFANIGSHSQALVGGNSGRFFNGLIDDVKVYNRVLSAHEIQQLYQLGRGGMFRVKPQTARKTISLPATWLKVGEEWTETQPKIATGSKASLITRPPIEPSYENGFAPRDGEPLYPNLFKGLVGAWCPSMGVTGNTLRDLSGRNNHGTLTNMDPATDWVIDNGQYALDFDGSNDYISFSNSEVGKFYQDNFTVSVWVCSTDSSGYEVIIGRDNLNNRSWVIGYGGSGANFQFFDFVSTQHCFSTVDPIINKWYLVTVTRQSFDISIYIDGSLNSSTVQSQVTNYNQDAETRFGSRGYAGFEQWFNGKISEVLFYSRALSPNEIKQLYQLGRGGLFTLKPKTIALPTSTIWQPSQSRLYTGEWK